MAITELNHPGNASVASQEQASKTKIIYVSLLFLLSLTAFVCQTEFTSQAYKLGFGEPIILLLVTHGSWWTLWPLQAFFVSLFKTIGKARGARGVRYERLNSNAFLLQNEAGHPQTSSPVAAKFYPWNYFKRCVVKQIHNVYHSSILVYEPNVNGDKSTSNLGALVEKNPHLSASSSITSCIRSFMTTPSFKYVAFKVGLISLVLNTAGFTWYGAMAMTYASDVTAIYNCSAFTAYAFAIPLLNEKFSWLKASSVIIAIAGVFVVAYSGSDSSLDSKEQYPYRFWGNLIISIGAVLYGYYEVLYKKYVCVPAHLSVVVTPRRQLTFSNFVMSLLGFFTVIFLLLLVFCIEVFHIHRFNLFNYGEKTAIIWLYIFGSIVSNLLFSAGFLSLMALTSPVLSSVSSLVTIFLIGVVEWVIFGNALGIMQLIGDALVIVGFVVLTIASWKEISEGNDDNEIEEASLYSFAPSEETANEMR